MFPFRAALIRIVVLMFLIAPAPAAAQSTPNVISGTVKDSSGGVLPGVTVKITSDATNTSTDIITNADGTSTGSRPWNAALSSPPASRSSTT
jgi:hypothetical protein